MIQLLLIWTILQVQPLASLSHGGMSTEFLWMLAGGKDAHIMDSLYPYYVDVSCHSARIFVAHIY